MVFVGAMLQATVPMKYISVNVLIGHGTLGPKKLKTKDIFF